MGNRQLDHPRTWSFVKKSTFFTKALLNSMKSSQVLKLGHLTTLKITGAWSPEVFWLFLDPESKISEKSD